MKSLWDLLYSTVWNPNFKIIENYLCLKPVNKLNVFVEDKIHDLLMELCSVREQKSDLKFQN